MWEQKGSAATRGSKDLLGLLVALIRLVLAARLGAKHPLTMPEGACRGSTRKGGREAPRPSSVSSLGGLGSHMASNPFSGSCTSMNTVCSDSDRPASLSSSASSASLQDHQSVFGGSGGLGGGPPSYTPQNGSDISLDLTPVSLLDGMGEAPGGAGRHHGWSPGLARAKERQAKRSHLDRVVQEILETEQAYVRDLRSIVEDYLGCIINCEKLPLKPDQVSALFCNIEDIYEFNSDLLEDMQRNPCAHAVAECFVQRSEEFDLYTLYCMNYPNSVSVLRECMEDEAVARFFRERQATLSHFLPLETYLLKPVQRILKYHLLLQELVKHYEKSRPGYDTVEEASITMTAVAWYINDMKRKQEHATRLQEIQGLLVGWNGPELGAFGELILEGQFRVPRARKERVFFLLSKVLLITKRRGEAFIYKSHIFCCNLALQENTKEATSFKISDLSIPKQQHVVQVKNQEEKRLWIHYLKRLIVENHPASIPQKAKQVLLENSFQGSPGVLSSAESPKKPLPSPWLDESLACARSRRQSEPPEYMYSPERARRSCPILALEKSTSCRRDRRPSDVAKLKHTDSEGDLYAATERPLPSRTPTATLASGRTEMGAEDSGQEEGEEGEFLLPEEATASGLSITEEILELLSQRGLDKEAAGKGRSFPLEEGGQEASGQALQEPPLQESPLEAPGKEEEGIAKEGGEEEEEEEEGDPQKEPSLGVTPHVLPLQADGLRPEPPPELRPPFASDSSEEDEEEEQLLQQEGSSGPSPLHVLETLAPEEGSGRAEEPSQSTWGTQEAPNQEGQPPEGTEASSHSACPPQSLLAPMSRDERMEVKAEGGAQRDLTLTRSDWLLIEKIKNYYEGVGPASTAPGLAKKDWAPPVPAGVVRESILHFNSIWRQNDVQDWEVGGARVRKPLPQLGASSPGGGDSGRSRSRSCQEEGRGLLPISLDPSKRGRSCSESGQSTESTEPSRCCIGQTPSASCENSHQGWSPSGDMESDATHKPSVPGSGSGLEEEGPAGSEFRSCAEIRRAWQEKERSAMDTPKKGGKVRVNRESHSSPEMPVYAEPLYIVEDSDLEDPPSASKGDPEVAAKVRMGAKGRQEAEGVAEDASSPLPSFDLYESSGDPCLLENSERILSKVQALAKMYSEKISRLKAPKRVTERKPGVRPLQQRRGPSGSLLAGVQEGKPGSSFPHCEPRVYGHILIQEPLHHVIGVQENTPLVAATRGTAFELHSERPPLLLSPDLLGPLRQELPCPPSRSPCVQSGACLPSAATEAAATHQGRSFPGSPPRPLSPEPEVDPSTPKAPSKGGDPSSHPGLATEATLRATKLEETPWTLGLDKGSRQAGQPSCGSEMQPGVPVATRMPESQQSQDSHDVPSAPRVSGPTEEATDKPPGSSAESPQLQKQAEPPSLPNSSSPGRAESPSGRADPMKLPGRGRREVPVPALSAEASRREPGACSGVAPHPGPLPEHSRAAPPPLPSSSSSPLPAGAGTAVKGPPPANAPGLLAVEAEAVVAESPGPLHEGRQTAPLPKLLPSSSPVRRCLSSSAAAISRYLAASCISHSLAKKNGGPPLEETPVPARPFPSGGAPGGPPADPLALLPRAAPKASSRGGRLGSCLPREGCQPSGSGPPSPTRHKALLATVQAFEPRVRFASASEPNSRAQSPSAAKPRVCSPPPTSPPTSSFTPLSAHPHGQPTGSVLSPVALRPDTAGRSHSCPQVAPSSLPDGRLTESLAPSPCAGPPDLGGLQWPNVPGLCLKYVNRERRPSSPQRRPPPEGQGSPSPAFPFSGADAAPRTDRNHQRASYSTTVNIQIGGSGRIASFSNAQVSLTHHPLLATPEPLSARKVNGSALEAPQNT
ncbi:pleckstrin homology domain-containing family G member 2 isoform X2 [Pogona vitticeps]